MLTLTLLYFDVFVICSLSPPFNSTWYQETLNGSTLLQTSDYVIWNLSQFEHGQSVNIVTQFDPISIASVGEKLELEFEWMSNGTNQCPSKYWIDEQYNYQCEYNISGVNGQSFKNCSAKSVNCIAGTGDFRLILFESNGTKITGSNYSDHIWTNMKGYEIRFNPHLSTKATRFVPWPGTGHIHKPCCWYLREDSSNNPYNKSQIGNWTGCFQIDIDKSYNFKFEIQKKVNNTMYLNAEMNNWSVVANHTWNVTNYTQTQWIPKYIDTMVIDFPNGRPYQFIRLGYKQ